MTKREAGSKGGAVSTPAKAEAVKRNGAKGGRPVEFCRECQCGDSQCCGLVVSVVRGDESEMQLTCTRASGHPGEHVACGMTDHVMHRWEAPSPVETIMLVEPVPWVKRRTKYGPSVRSWEDDYQD